jgi:hypothetical protein
VEASYAQRLVRAASRSRSVSFAQRLEEKRREEKRREEKRREEKRREEKRREEKRRKRKNKIGNLTPGRE